MPRAPGGQLAPLPGGWGGPCGHRRRKTVGVGNDKNHSGPCALAHNTRIKSLPHVFYTTLKAPQQSRLGTKQTALRTDGLHLAKTWEGDA